MEYENHNYGSKGATGAALGLGIAGTALGLLNNGNGLGGILGGNGANCSENQFVNRYELNMQNQLTNKDMEIAYLRGRDASKTDDLEIYKYVDGRLRGIEAQICQQAVVNAQVSANLSCLQNTVATLSGLTKTIIPIDNICPLPATATTTTAAG